MKELKLRTTDAEGVVTDILFRIPRWRDLHALDEEFPLLPGDEEEAAKAGGEDALALSERLQDDPERFGRFLGRCDRVLELVALEPKIVVERPENVEDEVEGVLYADTLGDSSRMAMAMVLFTRAGVDKEASVEIAPLSETGQPSDTSMDLPEDTAAPQPTSQESATN